VRANALDVKSEFVHSIVSMNEGRVSDKYYCAEQDACATASHEWEATVAQINSLDGLVVKVSGASSSCSVSVLQPRLQFESMAKGHLLDLIKEACDGLFRGAIIQV
jgi:hypothetical protein